MSRDLQKNNIFWLILSRRKLPSIILIILTLITIKNTLDKHIVISEEPISKGMRSLYVESFYISILIIVYLILLSFCLRNLSIKDFFNKKLYLKNPKKLFFCTLVILIILYFNIWSTFKIIFLGTFE
ncbi:MAG: hypothetical protein WCX30_01770 [Candidatus Paceibacterota bacterium]|jgi:hypothetical protein|nr:hypothetical protein [bacterium]